MHAYRSHTCGALRKEHVGQTVRLSGWVFRRRDHGHFLFIDLRDHYGVTQTVFHPERDFFEAATRLKYESVITVTGHVVAREPCARPVDDERARIAASLSGRQRDGRHHAAHGQASSGHR
jgi:aspartyl-tRNA synthetase